jgi:hypothetical protein
VDILWSKDLDPTVSQAVLSQDDELPVQSFREGWADVVAGNTIPASKLWE